MNYFIIKFISRIPVIQIAIQKSSSNTLYRLQIKVDESISTWRVLGFYIQCLRKLIVAKSMSTSAGNNCPLTTIASSSPNETLPAT